MTKKRIREFLDLMHKRNPAETVEEYSTRLIRALYETIEEVMRVKHRCKHHCKCGARCYRFKGHVGLHTYKKHKTNPIWGHGRVSRGFEHIHKRMVTA